jgi:ring-1,2-phenylacetyl-CoA epoxidase subunit PaaC
MTPACRQALASYLLAMADDELVIGYRDTEWTGAAPMLEEDLAFSSIGVDEVGHARLYYSLLHELTGKNIDYRARKPDEYLHARFVERAAAPRYMANGLHRPGRDWAYAIVRQYLYDLFDSVRLASIRRSGWEPLAQAVEKVQREEKYHLQHGELWFERLAGGDAETRARLESALQSAWPDALALFEPVEGEATLAASGLISDPSDRLRDLWLERLAPGFQSHDLALPAKLSNGHWELLTEPEFGGRTGSHSADWQEQWDDMTSVYRLDPAAIW